MARIHRWSVMIYGSLQAESWRPSTTVISIVMEHLSLVKVLVIYLNRLTTIVKYLGTENMKTGTIQCPLDRLTDPIITKCHCSKNIRCDIIMQYFL